MRKLSSSYSVTYELKNVDNKILKKHTTDNCYSSLYSVKIKDTDKLVLSDFITEETEKYSKIYIKRLSKICDLKLKFINENKIELTGFKNIFYVKLFTTLFRILFEYYCCYNTHYKEKNILFLETYIKKRNNSGYKDMLERLIYYYQKSKIYQGSGHGITNSGSQKILIKNIDDLKSWNSKKYFYDMQSFFSHKN